MSAIGFNSLFEMPCGDGEGAWRGCGEADVSILYLRCPPKRPQQSRRGLVVRFNSLFEMHAYLVSFEAARILAVFQFSI